MTYSPEIVELIKEKHRLKGDPWLLPSTGMVNEAWGIGQEYVLRINIREECDGEAPREAKVVPLVRKAGVRTPELLVMDIERDIVARPYTVYRRAPGVLLGILDIDPSGLTSVYEELGRELALLHRMETPRDLGTPREWWVWDARKHVRLALEADCLSQKEASEIATWMDFVEPLIGTRNADTLVHKDIHPWNLMVDPVTYELTAILDWGDAMLGDVSSEFASMPIVAVPWMLKGYADAGESVDNQMIAKSIFAGVGLAAWEIRDGDMKNYKRHWWRMPMGGWQEYKQFIKNNYPSLMPDNLKQSL